MDTQTQVILFHGLSLAKKHFKPKTIEVMVATSLLLYYTIIDASYLAPPVPTGMVLCTEC